MDTGLILQIIKWFVSVKDYVHDCLFETNLSEYLTGLGCKEMKFG